MVRMQVALNNEHFFFEWRYIYILVLILNIYTILIHFITVLKGGSNTLKDRFKWEFRFPLYVGRGDLKSIIIHSSPLKLMHLRMRVEIESCCEPVKGKSHIVTRYC